MEHTKGNWESVCKPPSNPGSNYAVWSDHGRICSIVDREANEMKANSKLIAQAPELLKACKCALADLEGIMPEHEPTGYNEHPAWKTMKELEAVIKKATE